MSEICFHYTSGILMETVWLTSSKCHYPGIGSVLPLRETVEDNDRAQPTYTRTLASEWLLLVKRGYRTLEKRGWSKCSVTDESITEVKELVQKVMTIECHRWNTYNCVKNVCGQFKNIKRSLKMMLNIFSVTGNWNGVHYTINHIAHYNKNVTKHLWRKCSFAELISKPYVYL
jgi:hypothetical protein